MARKKAEQTEVLEQNKDGQVDPVIETKKSKKTIEAEKAAKEAPKSAAERKKDRILNKAKPKKFVADGSEVFTQNVKTKLLEEVATLSPVIQDFISAFQKEKPLTAKVVGTRRDPEYGICAICNYGPKGEVYQVLIPYDRFTNMTEEELEQRNINKAIFLERRIDTTVDFIPEQYENMDDTFVFIGNRLLAMDVIRREMWYSSEVNHNSTYTKFQVGSVVEARVVGVYPKLGIAIELFGVESVIPIKQLAWGRIPKDLSSLRIHTGDIVRVKITDLKRGEEKPWPVWFKASLREAQPDPRLIAFNMIKIGDKYKGVVSMIQENHEDITKSRIFIRLENDGEAISNLFDYRVKPGSVVRVTVKQKYTMENGEPRIKVAITHVEPDPDDEDF